MKDKPAQKLRVSYTLLNLWSKGDYDGAVSYYFKLGSVSTPQMEEGIVWDNYVCDFANKHSALPPEFGGDALVNVRTQHKLVSSFNEYFDLVGVIDILTDGVLYEIKSGSSKDSAEYSNDFQVSLYLLLCQLHNIPVDKAIIVQFNQYAKTHNRTVIWNSEQEIERARNYIESIAPEILEHFQTHKLLTNKE